MRLAFEALCMRVLEHSRNGTFDAVTRRFDELPGDVISDEYDANGAIEIMVGAIGEQKQDYLISVTYLTDETDEDGPHMIWHFQSTYQLDEHGSMIREDRVPPSEEESGLGFNLMNDNMAKIRDQSERHIREIETLGQKLQDETVVGDLNDLNEARHNSAAAYDELRARHDAENESLRESLDDARGNPQDSQELAIMLGINRQPISTDEFEKMTGLVKRFYHIGS